MVKRKQEHREHEPVRSLGQEVALALLRAASLLQRELARVVEPAGITLQQYNVLRILHGAGAEGLPTLRIRERMVEEAPGITRLLDRLESAGLVQRWRSETDRRQVRCQITAAGLELIETLDASVDGADRAAVAMLDEADQRTLLRLLERIRRGRRSAPHPSATAEDTPPPERARFRDRTEHREEP